MLERHGMREHSTVCEPARLCHTLLAGRDSDNAASEVLGQEAGSLTVSTSDIEDFETTAQSRVLRHPSRQLIGGLIEVLAHRREVAVMQIAAEQKSPGRHDPIVMKLGVVFRGSCGPSPLMANHRISARGRIILFSVHYALWSSNVADRCVEHCGSRTAPLTPFQWRSSSRRR